MQSSRNVIYTDDSMVIHDYKHQIVIETAWLHICDESKKSNNSTSFQFWNHDTFIPFLIDFSQIPKHTTGIVSFNLF